jgi:hypothetical protein
VGGAPRVKPGFGVLRFGLKLLGARRLLRQTLNKIGAGRILPGYNRMSMTNESNYCNHIIAIILFHIENVHFAEIARAKTIARIKLHSFFNNKESTLQRQLGSKVNGCK